MASNKDFVQYIAEQCADAGEIVTRKMFGDYGIYCDGKIFGLICDDCFYVKPTEAGREVLREVVMRPPYEGAKDYFMVADVDDRAYLSHLVKVTCEALPAPKPKKKKCHQ
jgi:TfoX/Sxy family transcriptional regulator of competence genes